MTLRTEYLEDVDCGALGMLTLKVEFYYTPEEFDSCNDGPGWPEEYDVTAVYIVQKAGYRPMMFEKKTAVEEALIDISSLPVNWHDALVDMLREI